MLSSLWLFSSTCPGARSDMDGSERERASSKKKKKKASTMPPSCLGSQVLRDMSASIASL